MAANDSPLPGTERATLLSASEVVVEYPTRSGHRVSAVAGVSFDLRQGETIGVVGESGCGKSSLGRALMQLPRPTSGSVTFDGVDLTRLRGRSLRRTRGRMQMIFQDPISSLNPRRSVQDILLEALAVAAPPSLARPADRLDAARQILSEVGLDPVAAANRRPHEYSGGQCQRICIARALILSPRLVICDEPVSALDVSVQAQILNLLDDLKAKYDLSLMFISHDLAVVKHIADRVMVMYLGKVCELAPADELYRSPLHPYTGLLLASVAVPDPAAPLSTTTITGDLPSPIDPPSGCRFRTRCPAATSVCAEQEPPLREAAAGHFVACHHATADGSLLAADGSLLAAVAGNST